LQRFRDGFARVRARTSLPTPRTSNEQATGQEPGSGDYFFSGAAGASSSPTLFTIFFASPSIAAAETLAGPLDPIPIVAPSFPLTVTSFAEIGSPFAV